MARLAILFLSIGLVANLSACATGPGLDTKGQRGLAAPPPKPRPVDYRAASERADARPRWGAKDSEAAAKALAATCLGATWLATLTAKLGRKPVLRFHPVRDATAEQIDTVALARLLEAALHASGKVALVAPIDEAYRARLARRGAAKHRSDASAKREQRELAADAIMLVKVEKRDHESPPGKGPVTYYVSLRISGVERSPRLYCVAQHTVTKR